MTHMTLPSIEAHLWHSPHQIGYDTRPISKRALPPGNDRIRSGTRRWSSVSSFPGRGAPTVSRIHRTCAKLISKVANMSFGRCDLVPEEHGYRPNLLRPHRARGARGARRFALARLRSASDVWRQPQRQSEGQFWADMKRTTADNAYTTDKGGSKRNY